MAVLLEKVQTWTFSSDTAVGAQNVSADGSTFQVSLDNPISIPKSAIDCDAGVLQAEIWNTSPNISASFGNNIFEFTTTVAPAGTYTITIPEGLYTLEGLGSYLSSQFVNQGHPSNLFLLSPDLATERTIITVLTSGDSIDFTVANSVRTVLGFNSAVITAPSANYSFFGDTTASFNRNNSYVIAANLVNIGIPVNNRSRGVIGTIPINVAPGSQINYSPQNVVWFDASELIGNQKRNITFQLLNQSFQATPTSGDTWAFTILIRYHVLISSGTLALKP